MKKIYLVLLMLTITFTLFAENRVALLIANGAYKNFSSLSGPTAEAEALSTALIGLGFDVKLLKNATREQMLDELDSLKSRVKGKGGIAFLHYGGHGVQVNGANYLIPVDADIPDEKKVATRAVNIDEVMSSLDLCGSDTNIVILDACRNNPLPAGSGRSASRGLSVIGIKPRNSIIVYSAEAGTVAQDGLFTPTLTKYLQEKNISFTDVLLKVRNDVNQKSNGAQIPGEYNQLFNNIFFNGTSNNAVSISVQPINTVKSEGIINAIISTPKINLTTFESDFLKGKDIIYDADQFMNISTEWMNWDKGSFMINNNKVRFKNDQTNRMAMIKHGPISKGTSVYFRFKALSTIGLNINFEGPDKDGNNEIYIINTEGTYFTLKNANSKNNYAIKDLNWNYNSTRYLANKEYVIIFDYDYQNYLSIGIVSENNKYSFYKTVGALDDTNKTFVFKIGVGSVELIDYLEIID